MNGLGQKTVFAPRSQGLCAPIMQAGWNRILVNPYRETNGAAFAVYPTYSRSFDADKLNNFLIGPKELVFSGSQVIGRESTDILADYFGLPSDYVSVVSFSPLILNFMMGFDLHIYLDEWVEGLYCDIHMPIVHSKWDLNLCECVVDPGSTYTSYPAGYLSAQPIELSQLKVGVHAPITVKNALRGKAVFGDMQEPLAYGKIFGRQEETRVTELWLSLGWNMIRTDESHLGFELKIAAPTGTLRKAEFFFEPIVGNDHHWEFGAQLSGHKDLWISPAENRRVSIWLSGHLSHLFASTQKRSFDIKDTGVASRYMLLETMAAPVVALNNGLAPDNTLASIQYQGELVPAINRTTFDAKIRINVQADLLAKIQYYHDNGFQCEFGYNMWARTKEVLQCRDAIAPCYAVKGDAQVYGFAQSGETPLALAATQHNATLRAGQGDGNFTSGAEFANHNADNSVPASDNLGANLYQLTLADANRLGVSQIGVKTSNPARLIDNNDIDEESALLPKALSHTIFADVSYTIEEGLSCIPFLGVGAYITFANTDVAENSAYSQWSLWLKMGLSFN